jgi:hypothetical protein
MFGKFWKLQMPIKLITANPMQQNYYGSIARDIAADTWNSINVYRFPNFIFHWFSYF